MKSNTLKKFLTPVLAGLMFLSACSSSAYAATEGQATVSDVEFWATYSSEKVLQDNVDIYDSIKRSPVIDVTAIGGEEEATQIIMTTGEKAVSAYDVIVSDLTDGNKVFSKENIKVYHEKYIFVGQGMEYYTESGYFPDCLVPFENVKAVKENYIKPENNQGLYISFAVPETQQAGDYSGTLQIKIGDTTKNIPVSLTVADASIGVQTHVSSSFLNEWYFYRGELDTTEEMFDAYNQKLFDYRLGCNNVVIYNQDVQFYAEKCVEYAQNEKCPGYNIPWYGKNYKQNNFNFDVYGVGDGRAVVGPHAYDVDKLILYLETIAYEGLKQNVDPFKKAFIYGWDEPDLGFGPMVAEVYIKEWSYIVRQCKNVVLNRLQADVSAKNVEIYPQLVESLDKLEHLVLSSKYLSNDIDTEYEDTTYCPYFSKLESEGTRLQYRHGDADQSLWWYGCVAPDYPYPTYHIDDTVLSARIESWMKADYDIQGNLYWATCLYSEPSGQEGVMVYPEDFYTGNAARSLATNGEGFLFYPGKKYGIYGPLSSIRLEHIRDGLEEYEMIYKLKEIYSAVSNSIGISFTEDEIMQRLYFELYSGSKVGTSSENFENMRSVLVDLLEIASSPAKACIMQAEEGAGSYEFKVFVKSGYELKQAGQVITDKVAVAGGNVYSFELILGDGAGLDLSVAVDGKEYKVQMSFGASASSYNATYAIENNVITNRHSKMSVETSLVDATTVNPNAKAGDKYVKMKLGEALDNAPMSIRWLDNNVIKALSKQDSKFVVRIYNTLNEDIECSLYLEYGNSIGIYERKGKVTLAPGMNVLPITGLDRLRWTKIKYINSFRLDVGYSKIGYTENLGGTYINRYAECLYFVDMSVYR